MNRHSEIRKFISNYQQECSKSGIPALKLDVQDASVLDLRSAVTNDTYLQPLWKTLQRDSSCKSLLLDFNNLTGKGLVGLFELVKGNLSSLEMVSLTHNKIDEIAAIELTALKEYSMKKHKREWIFDLEGNNVNQAIVQDLKTSSANQSEIIDFSNQDLICVPDSLLETYCKSLFLSNNHIFVIENIPTHVLKLDLSHNSIRQMSGLDQCSKLSKLDLSSNAITKIEDLPASIIELNLGHNAIKQIENLDHLENLARLSLENNTLGSIISIRQISLNENLKYLILAGNPVASLPGYKPSITSFIPKLEYLDGKAMSTKKNSFNPQSTFFTPEVPVKQTLVASFSQKQIQKHSPPNYKSLKHETRQELNRYETKPDLKKYGDKPDLKKYEVKPDLKKYETKPELKKYGDKPELKKYGDKLRYETIIDPKKHENKAKETAEPEKKIYVMARIRVLFKKVYLLNKLPSTIIEELVKVSALKHYSNDQLIIGGEEVVNSLIVVYKGKVLYNKKIYEKGEYLFADTLIHPEEMNGDLISVSESSLYILGKDEFNETLKPKHREICVEEYQKKMKKHPKTIKNIDVSFKNKVKEEIDSLLRSADPYSDETMSEIERLAWEHLENPPERENLILQRPNLVKLIEEPPEIPNDAITLYLIKYKEDIKDEISDYIGTLKSLINSPMTVFSPRKTHSIKELLKVCEIDSKHEDPRSKLRDICGHKIEEPQNLIHIQEILELTKLANRYKDHISEAIVNLESHNEAGILALKHALANSLP